MSENPILGNEIGKRTAAKNSIPKALYMCRLLYQEAIAAIAQNDGTTAVAILSDILNVNTPDKCGEYDNGHSGYCLYDAATCLLCEYSPAKSEASERFKKEQKRIIAASKRQKKKAEKKEVGQVYTGIRNDGKKRSMRSGW